MTSRAIYVRTFSDARANLKTVVDQVVDDHIPVVIGRCNAEPVVMLSLSDWNSLQETAYLNSTGANQRAVQEGIAAANAGNFVEAEFGPDGNLHRIKPT